jgi:hypothetical protein
MKTQARMAQAAPRLPLWLLGLVVQIGLLCALLCALFLQPAQAHLMVAQHGTLNFVGTGGFVVMSLPVEAFHGVDDDGDGLMSMAEMSAHIKDLEAQVQKGLQLMHNGQARPLEAVLLSLSPDDNAPTAPARHLVVLGRFSIADAAGAPMPTQGLKLRLSLFGNTAVTQQQDITITRGTETQKMVLAPGREERGLFPSAGAVLLDQAALGAQHVLGGWHHMLLLLLVLAIGIAATVIGMVLFDRWPNTRRFRPSGHGGCTVGEYRQRH